MLSNKIESGSLPRHVAIILDGNGRWAQQRGKARGFGHQAGAENAKKIVRAAGEFGISVLTLYAFSTENWRRSTAEVSFLMNLFSFYLDHYLDELNENNVQMNVVGDKTGLPASLQKKISFVEKETCHNTGLILNLAVNYGGRDELLKAVHKYSLNVLESGNGKYPPTEKEFSKYLYQSSSSDVDLLIRTGGEQRISNFLLWQVSYAELYFTDILWPDFTKEDLIQAIREFGNRERRFGAVKKR